MNNDRHKFKVWNKKEKVMITGSDSVLTSSDEGYRISQEGILQKYWPYQDWPEGCHEPGFCDCWDETEMILHSTGLRDKNGELIFEGDIVKMRVLEAVRLFSVYWQDTESKFVIQSPTENHSAWNLTQNSIGLASIFEIIGNRYEEPGLLEGEK